MKPGDVLSYQEMCVAEGMSLQRGMNFRSRGRPNIILMSTRRGAPYRDRFEGEGRVLIPCPGTLFAMYGGRMEAFWRNAMATLNVKNFPDGLYQKLKKQARREGRSVAAEAQVLLAEALIRTRKYSVNDFRGVGAEIWQGVDVQKFLDREREGW